MIDIFNTTYKEKDLPEFIKRVEYLHIPRGLSVGYHEYDDDNAGRYYDDWLEELEEKFDLIGKD